MHQHYALQMLYLKCAGNDVDQIIMQNNCSKITSSSFHWHSGQNILSLCCLNLIASCWESWEGQGWTRSHIFLLSAWIKWLACVILVAQLGKLPLTAFFWG